jgi:hypothetical protein
VPFEEGMSRLGTVELKTLTASLVPTISKNLETFEITAMSMNSIGLASDITIQQRVLAEAHFYSSLLHSNLD